MHWSVRLVNNMNISVKRKPPCFWGGIHRSNSAVQEPEPEIEVGGKGAPEQIRDLDSTSKHVDSNKRPDHQSDQENQGKEPEKGKQPPLQEKEPGGPKHIEEKLDAVNQDRAIPARPFPHPCRTDAHQEEQNGPDNGEQDGRRRQGRPVQLLVGLKACHGEKAADATGGQGDQEKRKIRQIFIHYHHQSIVCLMFSKYELWPDRSGGGTYELNGQGPV